MKRALGWAIKVFSYAVVLLFCFALFGSALRHVDHGGKKLGMFTRPISMLAGFPELFEQAFSSPEVTGVPPTYHPVDTGFIEMNNLVIDLFMLNAFYKSDPNEAWEVRLQNLKTDSILHTWHITPKHVGLDEGARKFARISPRSSLLLPKRGLIAFLDESKNLMRLDQHANLIWTNSDHKYHHTMNLDVDGHIWICASESRGVVSRLDEQVRTYRDDLLVQVDSSNGRVIFEKSVSEIFVENGYGYLVFGSGNQIRAASDPLHLNDIQPVLQDGPYWQKGDVFFSLRHKSCVVLYRPRTNKVLKVIQGDFLNQHDIDIVDSTTIAVFDNNHATIGYKGSRMFKINEDPVKPPFNFNHARIVFYDFKTDSFYRHLESQFVNEQIFTKTQGLFEILDGGLTFVESQNDGKLFVFKDDEVVLKKALHTTYEDYVERPHWVRIYQDIKF